MATVEAPVFDGAGNVVGISVSMLSDPHHFFVRAVGMGFDTPQTINLAQNINFAIKFDVIKDFLDLIKENRMTNLGYKSTENSGKDIPLEKIHAQAEKFTVPVLCFKNKESVPLPVEEIGIDGLKR